MARIRRRSRSRFATAAMLLFLLTTLAGCGYRSTSAMSSRLPEEIRSLAVTEVTNNTLITWLPQQLRTLFRDEITKRDRYVWTDSETADALVRLHILAYSTDSRVKTSREQTVKFSANVTISAEIHHRVTGALLWDAGSLSVSESFFSGNEEQVQRRALELAVNRLVDRMTGTF